ncbi:PKD domain-containing protein [Actinoplanes sp. LDG1-06]|uniref:PKD domain-containing protein n=1 Tax=Paractinoplanes ovalisporus TaxID=2810368 RepID=A0ABS2ASP6_9ACTN|nr:PKD domain-containing protein [Actinoplanes ovalisporus]MBM2622236.1 PKD domain-containing protein [Actinoplanes ovalisporus]
MNTRLSRPLLAAVISGALASGLFVAPALAEPPPLPDATESPAPPTTPPATPPSTPDTTPPTTPPVTPPSTPDTTPPVTTPPVTPPVTTPPVTPPVTTPPPATDKTPPSGAFSLNRWSIFTGQTVTITVVGVADNVSRPEKITRVVTWGDGQTQTLHWTAKNVSHTYKSSGKKPITLTVTDEAGNKKVAKSVGPTVANPVLKYKLNKSSVWHGEKFVWEMTQVPAGATKVTVAWGDTRATAMSPKKQKITRYYYSLPANGKSVPAGAKTLKATVYNKYGAATAITVGKVTLKKDSWRPVLKLTVPSKASKASSWKAIKGTATDKGSGIKEMYAGIIVLKNNGHFVCWTGKSWANADTTTPASCDRRVTISKGKFSLPLKNTPKGIIGIGFGAADWAQNLDNFQPYARPIS